MAERCVVAVCLVIALGGTGTAGCASKTAPVAEPPRPLSAATYAAYLGGRIAFHEGDYAEAVRRFETAARLAGDQAPIQIALVDALARDGKLGRARREAEIACARWPGDARVWLASGAIYRKLGLLDRAITAYGRALALDSKLEPAYLGLAASYLAAGQPAKVEATYRAQVSELPASVAGRYQLARRLMQRGANDEAGIELQRVLELDPDHVQARVLLARTLFLRGQEAAGRTALHRAFDSSTGDVRIAELLLDRLLAAGDRDGALALASLLDRDSLPAATRLWFAARYLDLDQPGRALEVAREVLASRPSSSAARLALARALVAQGDIAGALDAIAAVTPADKQYVRCRAFAAEILARAGRPGEGRALVAQALAARPGDIRLRLAEARVADLSGDLARARALYDALLAGHPRRTDVLEAYAALEDRIGEPARALAFMETVLAVHPGHVAALRHVGHALADSKRDLARADRLLLRALTRAPGLPAVLDSYGWLLLQRGRAGQARTYLERASRLAPRDPAILWHLGEVDLARGERARAIERLGRAYELAVEPRLRERIRARLEAAGDPPGARIPDVGATPGSPTSGVENRAGK